MAATLSAVTGRRIATSSAWAHVNCVNWPFLAIASAAPRPPLARIFLMRLVTSWRIAVRSASFWSTSIFWFWTSCAAATAAWWSASTRRSSRRDSRASRCASFSARRSWSAIACCSERMVSRSARLWMLEMMSNQSRSPVLYMVAARLARIPRCASSASSALFRSMRERTRRWFTASSFACASTSFCPTLCSSLCRFAISARVRLASFCRSKSEGAAAARGAAAAARTSATRRKASSAAPAVARRGLSVSRVSVRGVDACPTMSLPCVLTVRGIGPAGRFLTAGQAGAEAPACAKTFAPGARNPLVRG